MFKSQPPGTFYLHKKGTQAKSTSYHFFENPMMEENVLLFRISRCPAKPSDGRRSQDADMIVGVLESVGHTT